MPDSVKQIRLTEAEVERLIESLMADSQRSEDEDLFMKLVRLKHRFERQAPPWAM